MRATFRRVFFVRALSLNFELALAMSNFLEMEKSEKSDRKRPRLERPYMIYIENRSQNSESDSAISDDLIRPFPSTRYSPPIRFYFYYWQDDNRTDKRVITSNILSSNGPWSKRLVLTPIKMGKVVDSVLVFCFSNLFGEKTAIRGRILYEKEKKKQLRGYTATISNVDRWVELLSLSRDGTRQVPRDYYAASFGACVLINW